MAHEVSNLRALRIISRLDRLATWPLIAAAAVSAVLIKVFGGVWLTVLAVVVLLLIIIGNVAAAGLDHVLADDYD